MKEPTSAGPLTQIAQPISFPYDITFADSEASPATRAKIEEYLTRLERHYDRIIDCKVFVRIPHKHGGVRFFHIHIQLDIPGKRIAVSREPEINDDHVDPQMAIKDAFDKVMRQLDDYVKFRREKKPH